MSKSSKISYKHYRSIEELPAWNFSKIMEKRDYRYLLKLPDFFDMDEVKLHDSVNLSSVWDKIFDEYIAEFGLSEDFVKVLNLQRKIAMLKIQMVTKNQWSMRAAIEIENSKLQQLFKSSSGEKSKFEEVLAYIEQFFKISLDTHKVSTKRFYTYLEIMRKQTIKNRANGKKNN
jgi:hypothetical protein